MGEEEFCGEGIEARVEKFAGRRDVDFSVFDAEIIAVNGNGGGGEDEEAKDRQTATSVVRIGGVHGVL